MSVLQRQIVFLLCASLILLAVPTCALTVPGAMAAAEERSAVRLGASNENGPVILGEQADGFGAQLGMPPPITYCSYARPVQAGMRFGAIVQGIQARADVRLDAIVQEMPAPCMRVFGCNRQRRNSIVL